MTDLRPGNAHDLSLRYDREYRKFGFWTELPNFLDLLAYPSCGAAVLYAFWGLMTDGGPGYMTRALIWAAGSVVVLKLSGKACRAMSDRSIRKLHMISGVFNTGDQHLKQEDSKP